MIKYSALALGLIITPFSATAQIVPSAETAAESRVRVEAAMRAPDPKAASPLIRRFDNWGDRLVIEVNAGSESEPVTAAIRAAHSALVRAEKSGPLPQEIIFNFSWADMITGPQFTQGAKSGAPLASMTAEEWFASVKYSGASEKGLIGLVSWCRRGGAKHVPGVCSAVKETAIERNVWNAVGG